MPEIRRNKLSKRENDIPTQYRHSVECIDTCSDCVYLLNSPDFAYEMNIRRSSRASWSFQKKRVVRMAQIVNFTV